MIFYKRAYHVFFEKSLSNPKMSSDKEDDNSESFESDKSDKEEEIPKEIENARNQWDEIQQQQGELEKIEVQKGVGGVTIDRGSPITFFDARAFLVEQTNEIHCEVPRLVSDRPFWFCFWRKRNMFAVNTWEKIYKISKISFDENDLLHHRILNTLHSLITGCPTPPARKGEHWEAIGFQSNDPITDLRGAGMMGLLLPLNLFAKFKVLSKFFVETSKLPEQNFPMMIVLISYAKASIEVAGTTNILKSESSFEGCWDRMAYFFAGMIQTLCLEWRNELLDFQHDSDRFSKVCQNAKSKPLATIEIGKKAQQEDAKAGL